MFTVSFAGLWNAVLSERRSKALMSPERRQSKRPLRYIAIITNLLKVAGPNHFKVNEGDY